MGVSNSSNYNPDDALHEFINNAVDTQVALRILVDKEIVTKEEVFDYREEVRNSPKYKLAIEDIQRQKNGFQKAKSNPQEFLQAILKAKMEGKIR